MCLVYSGIDMLHIDFLHLHLVVWRDLVNFRLDPYDDRGHGTAMAGLSPLTVLPRRCARSKHNSRKGRQFCRSGQSARRCQWYQNLSRPLGKRHEGCRQAIKVFWAINTLNRRIPNKGTWSLKSEPSNSNSNSTFRLLRANHTPQANPGERRDS